jgi:tetratricopeptide (TPR) repeat protein
VIPADDDVATDLKSALAELHALAGWTCVDSGLHDSARHHFAKSMELGANAELADAFRHAGAHMVDAEAYDDALKAFQLGLAACDWKRENSEIISELNVCSAWVLACLGQRQSALRTLNIAAEFSHSDLFEAADWDYVTYHVHSALGNIDKAAEYAASAIKKLQLEGKSARNSVSAEIALATLHVQTGCSDGPALAHAAIKKVAQLSSVRARRVKLPPLVAALSVRGNTELARPGTQVING